VESIKALQATWFEQWDVVDERLDAGDNEGAAQRMLELVFELEPGGFHQEKELQKEVVRQNARTLSVNLTKYGNDNIKLTCDYVKQAKVPTLIVRGGSTHSYWQRMAERFSECIPNAELSTIDGVNHRAPIEAIEELTKLILEFADKNSD
jgi:pimeloyl-ACP methyl ester carboxylesterase